MPNKINASPREGSTPCNTSAANPFGDGVLAMSSRP